MSYKSEASANWEPKVVLDEAVAAFRDDDPVLVYDDKSRENEVDMMFPAAAVTPDRVATLRNDAGGLLCVALGNEVANAFSLPFLQDELDHPAAAAHDLKYDDRSSFSLTVNHRDTRTGITDQDRAKTVAALGTAASDPEHADFGNTFRSPGHVHLLKAAPGLLHDRAGHTEMGIVLAKAANRVPAVALCEMLDDDTGGALSWPEALTYARQNDIPLVRGEQVKRL